MMWETHILESASEDLTPEIFDRAIEKLKAMPAYPMHEYLVSTGAYPFWKAYIEHPERMFGRTRSRRERGKRRRAGRSHR